MAQGKTKASLNRTTALNKHVEELTGHLLDSASYNSHGFAVGRQGRAGHAMPDSNLHHQGGQFIPQAVLSTIPQNRQSHASEEGSADADDPGLDDYGKSF